MKKYIKSSQTYINPLPIEKEVEKFKLILHNQLNSLGIMDDILLADVHSFSSNKVNGIVILKDQYHRKWFEMRPVLVQEAVNEIELFVKTIYAYLQ